MTIEAYAPPAPAETSAELALVDDFIDHSRVYDSVMDQIEARALFPQIAHEQLTALSDELLMLREGNETIKAAMSAGVDCLHGTSSLNLTEILRRGLVPSGILAELGVIAIGKENHSQPDVRYGVHVVPLGSAEETVAFAEKRVDPNQYETVNFGNYRTILDSGPVDEDEWHSTDNNPLYHQVLGQEFEARQLDGLVRAGVLDEDTTEFPVVVGIASNTIPETIDISPPPAEEGQQPSSVRHDTIINGVARRNAIAALFVPSEHTDTVRELCAASAQDHIIILPLEKLRGRSDHPSDRDTQEVD